MLCLLIAVCLSWIHPAFCYMFVGIQVVLTVFIVAFALGAVAEYKIRVILLGTSAYSTAVASDLFRCLLRLAHLCVKNLLSLSDSDGSPWT